MKEKFIVNLYIPVNTILTFNGTWIKHYGFPELLQQDVKIIKQLENSFIPCEKIETGQREVVVDTGMCKRLVKSLSFYQYLLDRMMREAEMSAELGIRNFIVQNCDVNYIKSGVIYWIMRILTSELRLRCSEEFSLGIKINDDFDEWGMDIACRNNFDFMILNKDDKRGQICFQRKLMMNDRVKIYEHSRYDGSMKFSEGIVADDGEDIKNLLYFRNNINAKYPLIVDLYNFDNIKTYKYEADYIILNKTDHNAGLDKDKLEKILS